MQAQGLDVFFRVEVDCLGVEDWGIDQGIGRVAEGVAVLLASGYGFRPEDRTGARLVDRDDLCVEDFPELLAKEPCRNVHGRPRDVGDDELDISVGVSLRVDDRSPGKAAADHESMLRDP